jgi:hypothetical protein
MLIPPGKLIKSRSLRPKGLSRNRPTTLLARKDVANHNIRRSEIGDDVSVQTPRWTLQPFRSDVGMGNRSALFSLKGSLKIRTRVWGDESVD